jgi:small subunit ribosomal protein S4
MARYTGPRRKVVRRVGVALHGLTRKAASKGPSRRQRGSATMQGRAKVSEYGLRLKEKQKLRYYYGVSETQLRRYYTRAARQAGPTGRNLLALLEQRLDNIVFRLGLAPSIPAARQLVGHGHVLVNGRRVTAPGFEVDVGDVIGVRDRSRYHASVAEGAASGPILAVPGYLERAENHYGGRVIGHPDRRDVPIDLQESLVVEFYAR